MRLDKCDPYIPKETSYRGRKSYMSAAKREEKQRGAEKDLQTNYWSPPIRKRNEPMKKQKRENEENYSVPHR